MTPAGIEPVTFRSVAQHLNHCATAVGENNTESDKCSSFVAIHAVGSDTPVYCASRANDFLGEASNRRTNFIWFLLGTCLLSVLLLSGMEPFTARNILFVNRRRVWNGFV